MYQIIYIDIDEEITSVIDKLRKAKTTELFLAIPKRALILQSIVSLKLLAREAEKLAKHLVVITQDPREQKTVEKSGIETRNSLEGLDTESEMRESVVPKIQEENLLEKKAAAQRAFQRKSMEEIGSNDFYDVTAGKKSADMRPTVRDEFARKENPPKTMNEISRETLTPSYVKENDRKTNFRKTDEKEEMLKNFFEEKRSIEKTQERPKNVYPKTVPVSGKLKKAMFILLFSGLLAAGAALAYLFIPKAEVKVTTKSKMTEKDLDLRGDVKMENANLDNLIIPAKIIEKEAEYTFSHPVTGKGVSAGQKARGTLVIYNEYSSEPQSLVATTRLESPDKKIFRITKGVTVPGTTQVGGKSQPGAIEAEVIADASGEEYNIDPAVFSIPGFKGSPKFDKFYAKSTAKMIGGNSSSQGSGTVSLTQTDLAMAKSKSEDQAKNKISEDLKNEISGGEIFSDSASEKTIIESAALSRVGDAVSEFQYRVLIKLRAWVFLEADAKKIFESAFKIKDSADNQSRVSLDYGVASGDLASGTMTIKVHGKLSSGADLDVKQFKSDLAGKGSEEIQEIIKKYPQISEIEIDVRPAFLFQKVPQLTSRIDVIVN